MERTEETIEEKIDLNKVNKVILIDWGYFLHSAVFAWGAGERKIPATYTCLVMIISCLKRIGVDPDDLIIVAVDGRGNWRKDIDINYKGNRKEKKEQDDIDWKEQYALFDRIVFRLIKATPFHFIRIDKLEADDIIATACKHYQDKECIVVSVDSDFEQLFAFPKVKLFSPKRKAYKPYVNPYKILASKIKKETTDNLITEIVTEEDYEKRKMIVSLIDLPQWITEKVLDRLNDLSYNTYDVNLIPYKGLIERFLSIYNSDCIIDYEKSINVKTKRKKKNVHSRKKIV